MLTGGFSRSAVKRTVSTNLANSNVENPIILDKDEPAPGGAADMPPKKKKRVADRDITPGISNTQRWP